MVERSFLQFSPAEHLTERADSSSVVSQPEESTESAAVSSAVKPRVVAKESVNSSTVANAESSLQQPPLPAVVKIQPAKPIAKDVSSNPEMQSINQSANADSTPQENRVGQENKSTAVALTNVSTAISANTAIPVNQGFQDALPRYDLNPRPVYPEVSRRRGQQGTVLLKVSVNMNGTVDKASVAQSSGHRILDRAALTAVRRWTFSPAAAAGMPVASRVVVPIDFVLSEDN